LESPAAEDDESQYNALKREIEKMMQQHFKPEFLNRIDDIILFRTLRPEQLRKIVDIQLKRVNKYLADKKIKLTLTDRAAEMLAREGYDPAFGARPLKRVVQRVILDAMATEILEGSLVAGAHVIADVDDDNSGRLKFECE
jgi:ATP-dependent Clp protease ATP-binding subunit ClpB